MGSRRPAVSCPRGGAGLVDPSAPLHCPVLPAVAEAAALQRSQPAAGAIRRTAYLPCRESLLRDRIVVSNWDAERYVECLTECNHPPKSLSPPSCRCGSEALANIYGFRFLALAELWRMRRTFMLISCGSMPRSYVISATIGLAGYTASFTLRSTGF